MLIRFKVENFRSFGPETEFSCLAAGVRGHRNRVYKGPHPGLRLLELGAVYGANASGKSNLYKAIQFARKMVVAGLKLESPIAVQPFQLNPAFRTAPSRFYFEVLTNKRVLAYSFAVDGQRVIEESLTELRAASERTLFKRRSEEPEANWDFHFFDSLNLAAKDRQFIDFVAKGTPRNQLFLHEAHARNVKHFEDLWRWFRHSLLLIDPQTTAGGLEFEIEGKALRSFSTQILRGADIGIERLGTTKVPFESLDIPKELRQHLENDIKEGQAVLLRGSEGQRWSVRRQAGELNVAKLVSYHRGTNHEEVPFDIGDESDGTQRIIDLLPAFRDLSHSKDMVVFIDELDRSLHSRLTRALIEGYAKCRATDGRNQLLFTTHDATLLDHTLLRRDEVSFIEKNERGESEISSLADFKLRSDKRLMKDYLLGRFGGVPNVHRLSLQTNAEQPQEEEDEPVPTPT